MLLYMCIYVIPYMWLHICIYKASYLHILHILHCIHMLIYIYILADICWYVLSLFQVSYGFHVLSHMLLLLRWFIFYIYHLLLSYSLNLLSFTLLITCFPWLVYTPAVHLLEFLHWYQMPALLIFEVDKPSWYCLMLLRMNQKYYRPICSSSPFVPLFHIN